jgi:proteasome lid subunit RPN8/RPN11
MKLVLPREFRARIENYARDAYPAECCGLIEGARDGDTGFALALHPARNLAVRRDRFEIHPEDHFAALKAARANGHAIIGCYHSHPGGEAHPSETDRAGAGEEDFLWLIAALPAADGPVAWGAFVYRSAFFEPVAFSEAEGADLVTSSAKLRNWPP